MIGQTISQYKILEKLGEGGMGVVYKARDTKLDRDVALKFLPAHLAASEQDKARFVQEAKAAAALNHPNVCSIIDIQEHDTPDGAGKQMFIIMEFVDGMTLRQKMESTGGGGQPYPLKQAVEMGIQVADGLAAAHEKGIVHRDVKPENIMVRRDGIAQVMDFGLAKLRASGSKITRLTKQGSTVGTAGYMSPEQVQGQDADHRSDIFSLGVLLYELFTGQLPFKGVHETALMYEIVNVEAAPMSAVNPNLDPELDRIVYECLQKDPEERYQSAKEISRDLKRFRRESSKARMSRTFQAQPGMRASSAGPASQPGAPAAAPQGGSSPAMAAGGVTPGSGISEKPSRGWLLWSGATFIAGLVVIALLWRPWSVPDTSSRPVTRVTIRFPENVQIPIGTQGIEISPDGKFISLLIQTGLEVNLYLRPSDRETIEPVLGSGVPYGSVYYEHFSPGGDWIAFTPGNSIKKASVFGGAAVQVCDVGAQPRGIWWGTDGNIYYGHISSVIYRAPEGGGTPEPVTTLDTAAREISHRFPTLLPDGKSVIYTIKFNNITSFEEAAIAVIDTKTHEKKILIRGGSYARYVPTGHLVYVKGSFIYAVPFDPEKLEVTGTPKKLFEGGWMNPFSGEANISFTRDGTLLYIPRGIESYNVGRIKWIDFQGKTSSLVDTTNSYWVAALSPDGQKLALHVQAANDDIWLYHLGRKSLTRLTFGGGNSGNPVWGADGRYVYYASERGTAANIYRKPWDGSGSEERLTSTQKNQYPRSMSPDGRTLSFIQDDDIWTLDVGDGGKPSPFLETPAVESNPVLSPDGKYIAYESNESGRYEIYISSYPSKSGKWQISSGGGTNPIWNPSGKVLYFAQEKIIYGVDIRPGASFDFTAPRRILDLPPEGAGLTGISPDGKRFAMNTIPYKELNTSEVTLVTEWFTELKKSFAGQ
jgi:serine/threonine protein kinase/Tol biopolymer transport system component